MNPAAKWISALEPRRLLSAHFDSVFAGGYSPLPSDTGREADAAVLQSDGKIVVAGHTQQDTAHGELTLARYDADGSADQSFNRGLPAMADPSGEIDAAVKILLQPDGKILVLSQAMTFDSDDGQFSVNGYNLTRFTADGRVDATFGSSGSVRLWNGVDDLNYSYLELSGAGKIDVITNGSQLLQLTTSGQPDSSFGKDGLATLPTADGSIVAAGTRNGQLMLLMETTITHHPSGKRAVEILLATVGADGNVSTRLLGASASIGYPDQAVFSHGEFFALTNKGTIDALRTDGTLDDSFGNKGALAIPDAGDEFGVSPAGRIAAANTPGDEYDDQGNAIHSPGTVWSFDAHGQIDRGFGHSGSANYDLANAGFSLCAVLPQDDGKITLVGSADNPQDFALVRLGANGKLDTSFGSNGIVRRGVTSLNGETNAIVAQPDGKFLVGGSGYTNTQKSINYLERYNADGSLDPSFVYDSFLAASFSMGGHELFLLKDGSLLAAGMLSNRPAVVRITAQGKLDKVLNGKGYVFVDNPIMTAKRDGQFYIADGLKLRHYQANGFLDTGFGDHGVAPITPTSGSSGFTPIDLDLQSNGDIIVTALASVHDPYGGQDYDGEDIVRVTAQGRFDKSFNGGVGGISFVPDYTEGGGITQTAIGSGDTIYSLTYDMDGYPQLVAYDRDGNSRPYLPDGFYNLDGRFDSDMIVQPDGKLVLIGDGDVYDDARNDTLFVERLNPDGSPDVTFNVTGSRTIDSIDSVDPGAVAVAVNGDLIVGGSANIEPGFDDPETIDRRVLARFRGSAVGGTVAIDSNGLEIYGTDRADTLSATVSNNKLHLILNGSGYAFKLGDVSGIIARMGDGNDQVDLGGISINSSIYGEGGNDTLIGGAGKDQLDGGAGADMLDGGAGFDTASYASRFDPLSLSLNGQPDDGAAGEHDNIGNDIERIVGGYNADRIVGSSRDDVLDAGVLINSDGTLDGAPEHDTLIGLAGNDRLYGYQCDGGPGNDTLAGSAPEGKDFHSSLPVGLVDYSDRSHPMNVDLVKWRVDFGTGEKDFFPAGVAVFHAGSGNDTINTQAREDYVYHSGQTIFGGVGDDTITGAQDDFYNYPDAFFGEAGNDHLSGALSMNGGAGNDTLVPLIGSETMLGGPGDDTADFSAVTGNLTITLDNKPNDGVSGDSTNVEADIENIIGGRGNDLIIAGPGFNHLYGGPGNDTLWGGGGNDTLEGGHGHDQLFGQAGEDLFITRDQTVDTLDGGAGRDRASRDPVDRVMNVESFI